MSRDYPTRPLVGVGAVIWRDDKVLLVRRGKPPKDGEWSLPGGAQELGETILQALTREVQEETGLTIKVVALIDVIDAIIPDKDGDIRNHYTLIDFAARWVGGDARAGDDVTAVRWVTLEEISEYGLWQETSRIIRDSVKLL